MECAAYDFRQDHSGRAGMSSIDRIGFMAGMRLQTADRLSCVGGSNKGSANHENACSTCVLM